MLQLKLLAEIKNIQAIVDIPILRPLVAPPLEAMSQATGQYNAILQLLNSGEQLYNTYKKNSNFEVIEKAIPFFCQAHFEMDKLLKSIQVYNNAHNNILPEIEIIVALAYAKIVYLENKCQQDYLDNLPATKFERPIFFPFTGERYDEPEFGATKTIYKLQTLGSLLRQYGLINNFDNGYYIDKLIDKMPNPELLEFSQPLSHYAIYKYFSRLCPALTQFTHYSLHSNSQ